MIRTYNNSNGGKVKVFFVVDDDGNTSSIKMGNIVVPMESGYQFFVDKYVAQQIDKVDVDFSEGNPALVLKEGEALEVPTEEEEKEKEIKELEERLQQLKAE